MTNFVVVMCGQFVILKEDAKGILCNQSLKKGAELEAHGLYEEFLYHTM